MDSVVVIADLLGSLVLLQSLHLCGCAVLVGTADVEHVVTVQTLEPSENVGGQYAADDVTEVGHIVDVGQRGGDEEVAAPRDWEGGVGTECYFLFPEFLQFLLRYLCAFIFLLGPFLLLVGLCL
jgi:hypothetical protein